MVALPPRILLQRTTSMWNELDFFLITVTNPNGPLHYKHNINKMIKFREYIFTADNKKKKLTKNSNVCLKIEFRGNWHQHYQPYVRKWQIE